MKKRLVLIAIVATSLFGSTNTALADAQSDYQLAYQQYKTALVNWNADMKAEQENFKIAMQNWNTAVKAAEQARKDIATKFKTEADAIKARTIAAVTAATTAKDKKALGTAGKVELDLAIAARNAALDAVVKAGMKPAKPTPAPMPSPPVKPAQGVKSKPGDKSSPKPIKTQKAN